MIQQTIKVVWPDNYELNYPDETIKSLWNLLSEMEDLDPEDCPPSHFELENGMKLRFNPYVFHQCYDVGRLTHAEMVEKLEIKEKFPKIKPSKRSDVAHQT